MQIDRNNIAIAIKLLQTGFPDRSADFWERGLARMASSRAHQLDGEPLGHLLRAGEDFVGLGLTPIAVRPFGRERIPRRVVNLSSWFVLPEHRWKLPLLLRAMMSDKNAVYTDLTPTREVEEILKKLSFIPLNGGIAVAVTPIAAAWPSHRITAWNVGAIEGISKSDMQLMEEHEAMGCTLLTIHTSTQYVPLILSPCTIKGVPAMNVIYCPDREALHGALGAICRKLAIAGKALMLFDLPPEGASRFSPGIFRFPKWRRRYIRHATPDRGIDHCYSELVHFQI